MHGRVQVLHRTLNGGVVIGGERRPAPVWFVRGPLPGAHRATDHRPVLLQLPAASCWFETHAGDGCWDDGVAWVPLVERVVAIPLPGPPLVLARGVLRGSDDTLVVATRRRLEVIRDGRRGVDTVVRGGPGHWSADGLDLPEGGRRARAMEPFATGHGVVWIDHGWVYRLRAGGRPEAVGPARDDDRLVVGPDGAVLVGDGEAWRGFAGPRSGLRPLHVRFAPSPPLVRFSRDGDRVALGAGPGCAEVHGIDGVAEVLEGPDVLPVSARRVRLLGDEAPGEAHLGHEAVLAGSRLFGPGGRLWDLDRAQPLGEPRSWHHAVPCGRLWAVVEAEDRAVVFLSTRTGEEVARVPIPEDVRASVHLVGSVRGGVAVLTADGAAFTVRPQGLGPPPRRLPPPPPEAPLLAPHVPWRALGFRHGVHHRGRTFLWHRHGLLAFVPEDAAG